MRAPGFTWIALALGAAAVPLLVLVRGDPGFVVVMVAAVVVVVFVPLSLSRIRVTVDHRGLRVVPVLTGIPLRRIPLHDVARAEAVRALQPLEWGGWGYRWRPGRRAVVLRGGPALGVTTTRGRRFAVTVPDADTGAALLRSLAGVDVEGRAVVDGRGVEGEERAG